MKKTEKTKDELRAEAAEFTGKIEKLDLEAKELGDKLHANRAARREAILSRAAIFDQVKAAKATESIAKAEALSKKAEEKAAKAIANAEKAKAKALAKADKTLDLFSTSGATVAVPQETNPFDDLDPIVLEAELKAPKKTPAKRAAKK